MDRSTFDRTAIQSASDLAVGHADPYPEPPVEVPMTAAGGLYWSAADLARFLAFQLNDSSIDGRMLLDPKSRWTSGSEPLRWFVPEEVQVRPIQCHVAR